MNGSYRIIRRWILFVFVDYYSIKYSHFGTFNSARQCDTSPIEPAGHVSPKTNSYRKSDAQSPHSKSIELTGIKRWITLHSNTRSPRQPDIQHRWFATYSRNPSSIVPVVARCTMYLHDQCCVCQLHNEINVQPIRFQFRSDGARQTAFILFLFLRVCDKSCESIVNWQNQRNESFSNRCCSYNNRRNCIDDGWEANKIQLVAAHTEIRKVTKQISMMPA